MKIIIKIMVFLLISLVLFNSINIVHAEGYGIGGVTDLDPDTSSTAAQTLSGNVLGVARGICWVAAVILIMWMGIKWLTSAPEGKAELKKGLIIALIAVVLLVGAGLIITFFITNNPLNGIA